MQVYVLARFSTIKQAEEERRMENEALLKLLCRRSSETRRGICVGLCLTEHISVIES